MKRTRPVAAALVGVALLVVVGCAPDGSKADDEEKGPSPLPSHAFHPLTGADIPQLETETTSDQDAHIHVAIPQIGTEDRVNAALAGFGEQQIDGYREALDGGDAAHAFLSVTWSAIGSSATMLGLLLTGETSPGASTALSQRTVWYDAEQKQVLSLRDLVTADGLDTVEEQVVSELEDHVIGADIEGAREIVREGDPAFGFDEEGRLLVGFDAYEVAPGSEGATLIAIDAEPDALLTSAGAEARKATLSPETLEFATPPAPTPRDVDCEVKKCVALTFDDGPSAATTPRLLDILAEEDVRATFFVVGSQVQARPDLVAREVVDGHEVGSHSWSHPDLTVLSDDALRSEVSDTHQAIVDATGVEPRLFRPPYGAHNDAVDAVLREAGYAEAIWSVDTLDWQHHDPVKTAAAASQAKPGAIVLMHDIHAATIDAVPDAIRSLRDQGYEFVTVSEMVAPVEAGQVYFGTY